MAKNDSFSAQRKRSPRIGVQNLDIKLSFKVNEEVYDKINKFMLDLASGNVQDQQMLELYNQLSPMFGAKANERKNLSACVRAMVYYCLGKFGYA